MPSASTWVSGTKVSTVAMVAAVGVTGVTSCLCSIETGAATSGTEATSDSTGMPQTQPAKLKNLNILNIEFENMEKNSYN